MHKGLTSYGDTGFSLFLRKAFIKGAGYTDAALDRPVIGITSAGSEPAHDHTGLSSTNNRDLTEPSSQSG